MLCPFIIRYKIYWMLTRLDVILVYDNWLTTATQILFNLKKKQFSLKEYPEVKHWPNPLGFCDVVKMSVQDRMCRMMNKIKIVIIKRFLECDLLYTQTMPMWGNTYK